MTACTAEPSHDRLLGLVGRRALVTSRAGDGTDQVPLTVSDVSDAVVHDGWVTFTVWLVGTADWRLMAPGRYHVQVGDDRFDMTLTVVARQYRHQHYRATLVQPVVQPVVEPVQPVVQPATEPVAEVEPA